MSLRIQTKNLSKVFGAQYAVKNLSLDLAPNKIHAVLGENGAGKSTLMKLLFGLIEPTDGQILIDGKPTHFRSAIDAIHLGLGMVQQHFCLVETMSAIDNIILGEEPVHNMVLAREEAVRTLEGKLDDKSLHVPWFEKVEKLGVGFRQRIEILKLLYRDSKVLILDEPTAVLTPQEVESFFKFLRHLRDQGRTIIIITHKINEVFQVCDEFHVLRAGEHVASGPVSSTNQAQLVKYMIGRELKDSGIAGHPKSESSEKSLVVKNLNTRSFENAHVRDLSLYVGTGEIVGIAGVEGSGQSSLVDCLMGLCGFTGEIELLGKKYSERIATGEIRDRGLALVPEDRHSQAICLNESCSKNFVVGLEQNYRQGWFFDEAKIAKDARSWIDLFDVRLQSIDQDISGLSGGNQQKIVFAREIQGRKPQFLICHQPTRGVDLGAIEKIHNEIVKLRDAGVSCLLLSSELDELMKLSDRIYVFLSGKVSAEFQRAEFDRAKIGVAMTGANVAGEAFL